MFKSWFSGVYDSASLYDTLNTNALVYAIPEYIRFESSNTSLITFVNMLGHHYDILYAYINHMTHINKREENLNKREEDQEKALNKRNKDQEKVFDTLCKTLEKREKELKQHVYEVFVNSLIPPKKLKFINSLIPPKKLKNN